jgi:hypothetical protein
MRARTKRALVTGNPTIIDRVMAFFRSEAYPSVHGKSESASQEASRHAAIHSMRIEQARGYLDLFVSAFEELRRVRMSIPFSKNMKKETKTLEQALSLIEVAMKKGYHVDDLNDPVLTRLDDQLRAVVSGRSDTIAELLRMMKNNESINGEQFAAKMPDKNATMLDLITEMQARLSQLAKSTR